MGKIFFNEPVTDFFKFRPVDAALPDECLVFSAERVICIAFVPGETDIVVRPHQVKLDPVVVPRFQIAVVQMPFQIRHAIVPVPVEDKNIDAVVGSGVDLHLGYIRIRLIDISPQWIAGLFMAFVLGLVADHGLPLTNAIRPEHLSPIVRMIGRPDKSGYIIVFCRFRSRTFFALPQHVNGREEKSAESQQNHTF